MKPTWCWFSRQNSSNSQRLREIGVERGIPSYLIDGAADLRDEWFENVATVLVTAGASAPETVVQECLDQLVARFGATIDVRQLRQETVHFQLPRELRTLTK
ncbi:MAG: hypothetical protein R3B96_18775 [Pirellulaceae bacterium]